MSNLLNLGKSPNCVGLRIEAWVIILLGAIVGLRAAEPVHSPASSQYMLAPLEISNDFRVSLFAAEPDALNPIAISIDEVGRVYLAETDRYRDAVFDVVTQKPEWLPADLSFRTVQDRTDFLKNTFKGNLGPLMRGSERVRLLQDEDGDGLSESSLVLAEGFTSIPTGPAAGILAHRGQVWFQCVPGLWRIDWDPDSSSVDSMRQLHEGFGVHVGVSGHDLHGITWGPEGRLYFSMGDRGFHVETDQGPLHYPDTGAVLRCEPDGSDLEVFAYGLRNPQEIVFDAYGNLFAGDNDTSGADKSRVLHILPHGDYGWRCSYQHMNAFGPWVQDGIWKGDIDDVLSSSGYVSQGPSGFALHPEAGSRMDIPGPFFICDFPGGIRSFKLNPEGATFITSGNRKWLWNVWATDLSFGPDGAVYVSDWVEGWPQPEKGRVYRITSNDQQSALLGADVRPIIASLDGMRSPDQIATFLAHQNQWVRREAQFRMVDLGVVSVSAFIETLDHDTSVFGRLHAVWGLNQLVRTTGLSNKSLIFKAARIGLKDSHYAVRNATLQWLTETPQIELWSDVMNSLKDSNQSVVLNALLTVGEWLGDARLTLDISKIEQMLQDVESLLEKTSIKEKSHFRHGFHFLLSQWIQQRQPNASDLEEWVHHKSESVRMAILQALKRCKHSQVSKFLEDDSLNVQESAVRGIYDGRMDDLLPILVHWVPDSEMGLGIFRRWLWTQEIVGGEAELHRLFAFLIKTQQASNAPSFEQRLMALDVVKRWGESRSLDPVTGLWRPVGSRKKYGLKKMLKEHQEALFKLNDAGFLNALMAWLVEMNQLSAVPHLERLVSDSSQSSEARAVALNALMQLNPSKNSYWFQFGLHSDFDQLRTVALSMIEELDDPNLLSQLLGWLNPSRSLRLRQSVILAVGRMDSDQAHETIMTWWEAMLQGEFPEALKLELFEVVQTSTHPSILALWQNYRRQATNESHADFPTELIQGGDVFKGKILFKDRAEIACLRCHIAEGQGGIVGPSLDGLSKRLSGHQILRAVLDPNDTIAPGYASERFIMDDEEEYSGIVLEENDARILIRLGDGSQSSILKEHLQQRLSTLSPMPEGVASALNRRELRDLMAYLNSL